MSAPTKRSVRNTVEERALSILRPLVIVGLLLAAVFPFYYMVLLSFRPLNNLLDDPGAPRRTGHVEGWSRAPWLPRRCVS